MAVKLKRPTKNITGEFAKNLAILGLIEKYDLETRFLPLRATTLVNAVSTSFNDREGILAVKLPLTRVDLITEDKFNSSLLKDFFDIESISRDVCTGITYITKNGKNFTAEFYEINEKLGENHLVLSKKTDLEANNRYRTLPSSFTFGEEEQMYLTIRFDPLIFLLEDSVYTYKNLDDKSSSHMRDTYLSTYDGFPAQVLKTHSLSLSSSDEAIFTIACSLLTIKELSKYHDLGIDGSFMDNLRFVLAGDPEFTLNPNYITVKSNQDLAKEAISVWMMNLSNVYHTIDVINNNIDVWNKYSYSYFYKNGRSFKAFEFLPEKYKNQANITHKVDFQNNLNLRAVKSVLFFPKEEPEPDFKNYIEDLDSFIDYDLGRYQEKWNKIETRAFNSDTKLSKKIEMAAFFIRKHAWPIFENGYCCGILNEHGHPNIFAYFDRFYKVKTEDFFNIPDYKAYFDKLQKLNLPTARISYSNGMRFEKHGRFSLMISSGASNSPSLSTPMALTAFSKIKVGVYGLKKTHLIINDSYSKQAWKNHTKEYVKSQRLNIDNSEVYIISTPNPLMTALTENVLKDRDHVHQYSKFISGVKKTTPKKKKVAPDIKMMILEDRTVTEMNRRVFWNTVNEPSDEFLMQSLFLVYGNRTGITIKGTNYKLGEEEHTRLKMWVGIAKKYFGRKIVAISKNHFQLLKDSVDMELQMFEDFIYSDEVNEIKPIFVNQHIMAKDKVEYEKIRLFIEGMQYALLDNAYKGIRAYNRYVQISGADLLYNFIGAISEERQSVKTAMVKILPYLKKTNSGSYYRWTFINFLGILPDPEYETFDRHFYQDMDKLRTTVFTKEEFKAMEEWKTIVRSLDRQRSLSGQFSQLSIDLSSVLGVSNYKNIGIDDQKLLLNSRLNMFAAEYLALS